MNKNSVETHHHQPVCGANPYIEAKEAVLRARGLLTPGTWAAAYKIARARRAIVESTFTDTGVPAVAVTFRGVVVVLVRERTSHVLTVLTVYAPGRSRWERIDHLVRAAAHAVHEEVDLLDRWRGWA